MLFLILIFTFYASKAQNTIEIDGHKLQLFPYEYTQKIKIILPLNINGREYILAKTESGKFTIIDVTVEKGKPFNYYGSIRGKGNQLFVDSIDFPTLSLTGLHSESELQKTISITERSIAEITMRGRPDRMSGAGFMAEDEDIISVLLGDNRIVRKIGLRHSDLAKTIFHLWNIIQYSNQVRVLNNIEPPKVDTIFYNDKVIKYVIPSCRGWQYSIFNDSIWGECHLEIQVTLSDEENKFIEQNYKHLTPEQKTDFINRLTHLHTGEMAAYYIQMYGFYEGHVEYRADPIVLAYMFGLKTLKELNNAFNGNLYETIINHHKSNF